jgi:transferrin binding protein
MIRKRTILSLALLASTAACGGGGGGGGGAPPAVTGSVPAGQAAATMPSTDFANPQVTMTSSGVSFANGQTSQTVNDDGQTLSVHVDGMPDMQFDLSKDVDNSVFTPDSSPFAQFTKTDADGNKITAIKFNDGSQLDATNFGIWQKFDKTTGALVASGAYATGIDTPADQMPTSGTATYVGNAAATGQDGTGSFTLTGSSNVTADFGKRLVTTDIGLNKGDQAFVALHSADGAIAANSNKFAGSIQGGGLNGGIQGAFFGTAANQRGAAGEVGGTFAASGGGTSVNGSFGAGQTGRTP